MKKFFMFLTALVIAPICMAIDTLAWSPSQNLGVIAQNPIIGKAKNKLGNVVFSTIFGKNIVKGKALSVHNPRTTKQTSNRIKFSVTLAFLQPIIGLIQAGFKEMAIGMSAFNAAMSYNRLNALTGIAPNITVDLAKVVIAKGSLMGFDNLVITSPVVNAIHLAWDDNTGYGNAQAADLLRVGLYEETTDKWVSGFSAATRADGAADIDIPAGWAGKTVHVYPFFASTTSKNASMGESAGTIVAHA